MNAPKNSPRLLVSTAVYTALFAVAMFLVTRAYGGTDSFETIVAIMFFLWLIPLPLFYGRAGSAKREVAWFKRQIGRLSGRSG